MNDAPRIARATFRVCDKPACTTGETFAVHFNPQSLQYTITNNLKNKGAGNRTKQYVDKSTGKLVMDLIFDTTDTGRDVRLDTVRVAKLMEPKGADKAPPTVQFGWGAYSFTGLVEGYKETIDFFSADGVPLRASVNLTLASQDKVFEGGSRDTASLRGTLGGGTAPAGAGAEIGTRGNGKGRGLHDTAGQLGDPGRARELAEANGIENPRFPDKRTLRLDAQPGRPVGASDPVSGSPEGFDGLRRPLPRRGLGGLDPQRVQAASGTDTLSTNQPADFGPGGVARADEGGGLGSEVGRSGDLRSRLRFEENS